MLLDHGLRDWLTIGFERIVLVVVRTATTLTRLLDVLSLIASDRRIQVVFTFDPDNPALLGAGVEQFLRELQAPVIPWRRATRSTFDLAIAASENGRLAELDAPVLLVPHGIGYQKYYPNTTTISGMSPDRLVDDGRVVPATIALAHPHQRARLRAACPAAAERAVVVGDPSLARMLGSAHRQRWYRERYATRGQASVVLASTWGPYSLFGSRPELADEMVAQLPVDEYQVTAILHPGIWSAHGPWQVRTWLSSAIEGGLHLACPHRDWQAALVGASVVLADHGSLALYAAALDKPLIMAGADSPTTVPDSALAALAARAPRLDPGRALREQIDAARAGHVPGGHEEVTRLAVRSPRQCAQRLRPVLYGLLGLSEPAHEATFPALPLPALPLPVLSLPALSLPAGSAVTGSAVTGGYPAEDSGLSALVVGATASPPEVALERYPDPRRGPAHDGLDHRHLVADVRRATVGQLDSAAVLITTEEGADDASWPDTADALLRQWPNATLVAAVVHPDGCRVRTRHGGILLRVAGGPARLDPLLLASLAYVRLCASGRLPDRDRLRVGARVIEVLAEGD